MLVTLNKNFKDLNKISDQQLKEEVLKTLHSVGYEPKDIEIKKTEKSFDNKIKVTVKFDEDEAIKNWKK